MIPASEAAAPRACRQCVLDWRDDPALELDAGGVCTHCAAAKRLITRVGDSARAGEALAEVVEKLKAAGRGRDYDCLLGVSGGIDSTYAAVQAKRLGLRPLIVHYDNGWNSELAVMNIENLVKKLGFDLYTHVNDWAEFKDIQLAFMKASVIDIELITDHAINAVLHSLAERFGVRYIISGSNSATEAVLPSHWYHWKPDLLNIVGIHARFGRRELRTYPQLGYFRRHYYTRVLGVATVPVLDYVPYVKEDARRVVTEELGWRDYGGKHHESIFTRFYQSYILPVKFGVDKRKAHLSAMICSGQIDRAAALRELQKPICDPDRVAEDKEYVLKKLGLSARAFEEIMALPVRRHLDYPSYFHRHYRWEDRFFRLVRPVSRMLSR